MAFICSKGASLTICTCPVLTCAFHLCNLLFKRIWYECWIQENIRSPTCSTHADRRLTKWVHIILLAYFSQKLLAHFTGELLTRRGPYTKERPYVYGRAWGFCWYYKYLAHYVHVLLCFRKHSWSGISGCADTFDESTSVVIFIYLKMHYKAHEPTMQMVAT